MTLFNLDPEHPMDHRKYVLEQVSPKDGSMVEQQPWPQPNVPATMSHTYRHYIVGGKVDSRPILIAMSGTYGPHTLHAYRAGLKPLWRTSFDPARVGGSLGSHLTPIVDIDQDGSDELFVGERCLSLRDGKELFCCDREAWKGHSDIIQPVWHAQEKLWYIWTCRETPDTTHGPRVAMFDHTGRRVWSDLESGHMDTGWAARVGPAGAPMVLGVKIGNKVRTASGERRTEVVNYTYEAFTGHRVEMGFDVYTTIPVDLNGDGVHELVRGYFEGDGSVYDRTGRKLGSTGGLSAIHCKFTSQPGEQILSYQPNGVVRIWYDRNAVDSAAAKARYATPFYQANRKLTGVGYNLFNLGGI